MNAAASAAGSATLTINCRRRTGNPITYPRCAGARSMVRIPRPDPFTSHRPAKPCTPRLNGCSYVSAARETADLGK